MLKNPKYLLIALLIVSFFLRFYRISIPTNYIFDEVYHVVSIKAIANNNPDTYNPFSVSPEPNTAYDWLHPPLAKLIQASSVSVLGESSLAWRLPSAIFGTLSIYVVYLLALTLTKNPSLSLLASTIFSLDNLQLTMSRIAMNDIFVTAFILLALNFFYLYLKGSQKGPFLQNCKAGPYWAFRHLFLTGLFTGLAIATKHSGALLYLIYFIYLLPTLFQGRTLKGSLLRASGYAEGKVRPYCYLKNLLKKVFYYIIFLAILPFTIYILSYSQAFILDMSLKDFYNLHQQIYWYQTGLTATHPCQSPAWQWPLLIKPVWFYVNYLKDQVANIYNLGNPVVFWGGLISFFYLLLKSLKTSAIKFTLISYLALFTPFIFSPRIMFLHHYLPSLSILTIITAQAIHKNKSLTLKFLILVTILFLFFYPLSTAIPLPSSITKYWFFLPSWK